MQHHAQIKPCVAAISVSAVIEINVFDYNMHARARAQCEWGFRDIPAHGRSSSEIIHFRSICIDMIVVL